MINLFGLFFGYSTLKSSRKTKRVIRKCKREIMSISKITVELCELVANIICFIFERIKFSYKAIRNYNKPKSKREFKLSEKTNVIDFTKFKKRKTS